HREITSAVVRASDSCVTTSATVSACSWSCLVPTTSAAAAKRRTVIIGLCTRQFLQRPRRPHWVGRAADRWPGPFWRPSVNWMVAGWHDRCHQPWPAYSSAGLWECAVLGWSPHDGCAGAVLVAASF